MSRVLLIGLGGFLGAVLRYAIQGLVQGWSKSVSFPYGTLAVNVVGCLVIGLISELAETRGWFSGEARLFAIIGVLGAFSTFSSFSNETMNLLRDGQDWLAFANVSLQLVLGLGAVWLGRTLGFLIWR